MRTCFPYLAVLLTASFLVRASGQDLPEPMTPALAAAFPFQTTPTGVTVKYPVLLNPTAGGVVKPGTTLISIYVLPPRYSNPTDLGLVQHAEMEKAYSRDTRTTDEQGAMPKEEAQMISHAKNGQWTVPNNFILAMAQSSTDLMHLICKTGTNHYIDETFRFCDGVFVGLPGEHVTVISLEDSSPAASAGLKAGDQITAIAGTPIATLTNFAAAFAAAKQDAVDRHKSSYTITVIDEKGQHDVNITIPSFKLDGF